MIKENQFSTKGFAVWAICGLFFLYEFFLRTVIGTFQHPVMYDLKLSSFQFSFLSTTIFLALYGIMQIPVGIIVDNIGLKKSLFIGSAVCAISSFGFAYSYSYSTAILFRMLMGFGAAFGFVCLLVAVYDWMPHRYIAIFIGLSQFIGTLGPMLAAGPLETLSHSPHVNWRSVFSLLGYIGIVIFILILMFVENNKKKSDQYIILHKAESIKTSIGKLFTRTQPWYIAFLSVTLYFTIEYLSENEGRIFLGLKGFPLNTASYMITIAWLGYALGSPLLGLLSDFLTRRKKVLILTAICNVIAITTIVYSTNLYFLFIAFFLLGIAAAGQTISFTMISEQFKKQFVAIGFGLNNAMITIVAAINAPLIGYLIDYKRGGGQASISEYHFAFTILLVIAALSLILAIFFIKETYCKSAVDFTYLKQKSLNPPKH